jgi:hypothetical protein
MKFIRRLLDQQIKQVVLYLPSKPPCKSTNLVLLAQKILDLGMGITVPRFLSNISIRCSIDCTCTTVFTGVLVTSSTALLVAHSLGKSNFRPKWLSTKKKVRDNTETTTHRQHWDTGWHQNNKMNANNGDCWGWKTPPIPPHDIQQQSRTNSTYTLKRVEARTGGMNHIDLAMVWASVSSRKRVQSGEMTNGEVMCWMEVSHRLCSQCISAPLSMNAHRVRLCQFWLQWI